MTRVSLVLVLLLVACNGDMARGDPVSGEQVAEDLTISCGLCHTLEGAEFNGIAGPDLDHLQPGYQRILDAIRTGPGLMPSYRDTLSRDELHDLASYISRSLSR